MAEDGFVVVRTEAPPSIDCSVEEQILATIGARLDRTTARDEEQLAEALRHADAVIVMGAHITERVAAAMEHCQVVVRWGVGYDTLDVPALTRHGIIALNLPDIWTDEVANQALALLLALNRRLFPQALHIRAGGWREPPAYVGPLYGETIGIIGLGRIGSALARRCQALGLRVIAYDPYVAPDPAQGVEMVGDLHALLAQSDYVSVNCLLNAETYHLIDETQLRSMRPHAYLLNTARGPIVSSSALIRALQEGWIAGAGLDAVEPEPLPQDSPLRTMENAIVLPHSGFYSNASAERVKRRIAEDVVHVLQGGWPRYAINAELASHPRHRHRSGLPAT